MSLLDNSDPRVQSQFKEFTDKLEKVTKSGAVFNRQLVYYIEQLILANHRTFKLRYGYDFPPLGVFVLPSIRFIICVRKDLEPLEIQNQVLIWLRQFHAKGIRLEAQEIALAIKHCWPDYEPPIELYRTDSQLEGNLH